MALTRFNDDVMVLGLYEIRCWKSRSEWTRRILQLKRGSDLAVEYFADWLKEIIDADCVVVPVPSARCNNESYGVGKLAARVAQLTGAVDGSGCLFRFESIPKLAAGGPREERVHFESIEVWCEELFAGKDVVLLDDVITSGASIRACKFLLQNAGAASVKPVVLARAVRREFE